MINPQVEFVKCLKDKTRQYFIENYLYTFDGERNESVPFKLFPRQIAFLESLTNNSNTIAIKHRQAGITTITSAWVTGEMVFTSIKSPKTILCVGNKLDISRQLVEKIRDFLDQVPRWMWGTEFYSPDPEDKRNVRSIYRANNKEYLELFNGCKVYARSSNKNAARGVSAASVVIFDEAAFIENSVMVYAQAVATTASVPNAKVVMISTPNGLDPLYYHTYQMALRKENNFNAVEFKWYQDLRYNCHLKWYRKDKKTGNIERIVETVIGKGGEIEYNEERWRNLEKEGWKPTSPWYTKMCKTFNEDPRRIAQELDVSFLGSSDNVVEAEVIEAHKNQNVVELPEDWPLKDPIIKETWIWKEPIPGHRYVCAVDNSSGSADDRTAVEIFDVDAIDDNGMPYYDQVLEYYGKMTGDEVGEIVFVYASHYNEALVVVEDIGGYGSATILTLMAKEYPNLYYDDPGLKTYTIQKKYSDYGIKETEKLPGFHTNAVRVQMISNFVALLKSNTFRIRSSRVIAELNTWIWKNGRPDHQEGAHDDSLTCLSMGLFVMEYSMLKNERRKEKDKAMITSWFTTSTIPVETKPKNHDVARMDMPKVPKSYKFNPFVQQQHDFSKHVTACVMLGGFKVKSMNNS